MGLELKTSLQFIELSIDQVFPNQQNLKMLELGDQEIMRSPTISVKTGKEYFSNLGFDHTSVDLNGKNGALKKDLTKPEDFDQWKNHFHIITNSGTTEHVEPYESQYDCFKILHHCLKVGGVIIHAIPDSDCLNKWRGHCKFYYNHDFFYTLAQNCGYDILRSEIIDQLICVALVKKQDVDFSIDKSLFLSKIKVLG